MSAPVVPTESLPLPGGGAIPLLGFGTWQLTGPEAETATAAALAAGYRHLDTATVYGNEREVGRALAASGVPRDEVFLTSKLPPDRADWARATLEQSLEQLGVDTLDLWLIHWPAERDNVELWQALLAAQDDGLAKDIGVSNFGLDLLDEVTDGTSVAPAVNQIRWSPLLFDAAVLAGHQERGTVLEGYSALKGGTLDNPVIIQIATRLGRTAAQVIVRWHLQHGTVVIPRSTNPGRIAANADVGGFTLSDDDMSAMDALSG